MGDTRRASAPRHPEASRRRGYPRDERRWPRPSSRRPLGDLVAHAPPQSVDAPQAPAKGRGLERFRLARRDERRVPLAKTTDHARGGDAGGSTRLPPAGRGVPVLGRRSMRVKASPEATKRAMAPIARPVLPHPTPTWHEPCTCSVRNVPRDVWRTVPKDSRRAPRFLADPGRARSILVHRSWLPPPPWPRRRRSAPTCGSSTRCPRPHRPLCGLRSSSRPWSSVRSRMPSRAHQQEPGERARYVCGGDVRLVEDACRDDDQTDADRRPRAYAIRESPDVRCEQDERQR